MCVKIDPDVDLGWTSSTTVSLLYDEHFIGEATFKNSRVIPDDFNMAWFNLKGIKIWNMHGFKAFIQHIIPRARDGRQLERGAPTVALAIDEKDHKLSVNIRLDTMGFAKALEPTIRRTGDEIKIAFFIRNPTRVGIRFAEAHFVLQKDGCTLAKLQGTFNILPLDDKQEYVLKGCIRTNIDLCGRAVLKGADLDNYGSTWYIHAIRQFEMEVDLDEMIHGEL